MGGALFKWSMEGVPQMRNGLPTALEWRSANAEWGSDGVGVAFRKCGMGFRRRWSGVPQMRNGVPTALEWRSANAEWEPSAVSLRLFLDFLKSVFQILEFLADCLEAGGEFGLPLDGIAVVAELLPGAGEG